MIRRFTWAAALLVFGPAFVSADTLVVFTQPTNESAVAKQFAADTQPALAELAASMDIELQIVDVAQAGAPAEVGLTPLFVFQNHRGRSIYQGRSATLDRVRNLIRTARFRPQEAAVLERPGVPFETRGRMTLATPIKVTGSAPRPPSAARPPTRPRGWPAATASSTWTSTPTTRPTARFRWVSRPTPSSTATTRCLCRPMSR